MIEMNEKTSLSNTYDRVKPEYQTEVFDPYPHHNVEQT